MNIKKVIIDDSVSEPDLMSEFVDLLSNTLADDPVLSGALEIYGSQTNSTDQLVIKIDGMKGIVDEVERIAKEVYQNPKIELTTGNGVWEVQVTRL